VPSYRRIRRLSGALILIIPCFAIGVAIAVAMHSTGNPAVGSTAPTVARRDAAPAVRLDVQSGSFGQNRFLLTLDGARGRQLAEARVEITATMLTMQMPVLHVAALPIGKGVYQASGLISMPGLWRITTSIHAQGLPATGISTSRALTIGSRQHPMPALLPVLQGHGASRTPVLPGAAEVRWSGLPERAVVTFLGTGKVYVPGDSALLSVGRLNHALARVPGRDEIWVTDYAGNRIGVLDPRRRRVVASIPVGLGPVHVIFSADGRRAWVTDFLSNEVSVIGVAQRRVIATVEVPLHPHGLASAPNGRQVWVACSDAGILAVLDTRTNRVVDQVPAGLGPHAVAFSPDGRTVYMTDFRAGMLVVLDRASTRVLARIAIGTGSAMDAVNRDGSRVYVTGQAGSMVSVVDTRSRRVLARIPVGPAPHGLALTPDDKLLYVAVNNGNHISVIDTATSTVRATIPLPGPADELILWK
jgi:YVTN family beta-propeller protein